MNLDASGPLFSEQRLRAQSEQSCSLWDSFPTTRSDEYESLKLIEINEVTRGGQIDTYADQ